MGTGGPTAMRIDAVLTLTQWFSPAYPVGAFGYSHGLEAAVGAGEVTDAASLHAWLHDILEHGTGRADALFLAARLLFKLDRFAESSLIFERVTREQPARRAGWYNYGICLEAQRDLPGATTAYQRALELDPTYTRAADALARLSADEG